jgi:hypothetical protein
LATLTRTGVGNWSGRLIGALAIGAVGGALFKYTYPSVDINPQLSLLFGLIGLIIAWSILRERRQ